MPVEAQYDCDLADATEEEIVAIKKWAKKCCDRWNWNNSIPEIAQELLEQGLSPDDDEDRLSILETTFKEFFDDSKEADNYWELIIQTMEVFG